MSPGGARHRHPMRPASLLLFILLVAACGAGPSAPTPAAPAPAAAPPSAPRSPIGINLSGIQPYNTAFPFMDVFKSSGPWISGHGDVWDDGRRTDVDEHGWVRSLAPGQIVYTIFVDNTVGRVPTGRYTVLYDGEGEITYGEGARLIERAPGRDLIEIDPSRGNSWLGIAAVNPGNYLRNIRIRLPIEAPDGEVFNPRFVERIRGFGILRFMCWMLGDNPEQIHQPSWDDRPEVDDARWSERGVPVEVMVDLANRVGADPWFSIPHDADDAYVRRFAEIVRERLDPGRTVYVEHSNEVWNPIFSSHAHAIARGNELGLSNSSDEWTHNYEAWTRYHARRSREIWDIFEEILGDGRSVSVLAAQTDGPAIAETVLGYEETAHHTELLALGAYFGFEYGHPDSHPAVLRMTPEEFFHDLEASSIPATIRSVRENVAIADRYRIPVIAYEGGQHLNAGMHGSGDAPAAVEARFDEMNRDPRMGRAYLRLLEEWDAATNHAPFLHLNECDRLGPYGRWGLLEYIDQPREEAPKFDAVRRWIEGEPR